MPASAHLDLSDIQRRFREAVLGSNDTPLTSFVNSDGLIATRIAVYRNTIQGGLLEVLVAAFPVTQRVIGPEFFANLAGRFVSTAPPTAPQLLTYGGGFAQFIATQDVARRLPYLADVARLEWAKNESYFAADAAPLDPARLAALSPDVMAQTVLRWHPATRLITSRFPIHRIWEINQPAVVNTPEIDMTEGQTALVSRAQHHVAVRALAPADAALVAAIYAGKTLKEAVDIALEVDASFDVQAALQAYFVAGVFQNELTSHQSPSSPTARKIP